MTPSYRATVADVFRMLDDCAPTHTRRIGTHRVVVNYRGQAFFGLPKGPGGGGEVIAVVEYSKIRRLSRELELDPECVKRHFVDI